MGELRNARHERFCQLLATPDSSGLARSRAAAYRGAFRATSWKARVNGACRLLKRPEVTERVRELQVEAFQALLVAGIAAKEQRLAAKHERWQRLHELIAARAASGGREPGAATGLLVPGARKKGARGGGFSRLDTEVLAAILALEESAAREMGQIVDRRDVTSAGRELAPMRFTLALGDGSEAGDGEEAGF